MKRQIMGLFVGIVFLVAAVPVLAEEQPLPKPDVLTEEEVFTSQKLSGYDTIVLRDLKLDGAELSNIDSEEMPKFEAMKPMLARTVTDSLEMELKLRKLFKTIQKNGTPKGKAIILEGSFTEFNAGNRAARFWVGFGAGKTYLKVKGQLIDAETGKQLATFEDRETGYRGAVTMESFDDLFPHQAKSLGENIANFIQKLY
ncbi:MAG TPA: DUF4410 domain-containing protein [Geomobilimonas sp.]|nr:DUF4410 domain-containing protein [Geomobilimonas sp.]